MDFGTAKDSEPLLSASRKFPVKHAIVTYCSGNFIDCLARSLPTWEKVGDPILIYTDDTKSIRSICENKNITIISCHDEKKTGKRINCMRKIDAIELAIKRGMQGDIDYITWLDSDCFVLKNFRFILKYLFSADLLCTRMVKRVNHPVKTINAGVSMWRVNMRTLKFCESWREMAIELESSIKLNEQYAFNELCYKCFDWNNPCFIAPISEKRFNLENDNDDILKKDIRKYNPFIVHLKSGRWKRHKEFLECDA